MRHLPGTVLVLERREVPAVTIFEKTRAQVLQVSELVLAPGSPVPVSELARLMELDRGTNTDPTTKVEANMTPTLRAEQSGVTLLKEVSTRFSFFERSAEFI
jgi:hypothetical protein